MVRRYSHFQSAFCIQGEATGAEYHKKDKANQNQNRYLEFHQVTYRKETLGVVDKHNRSDEDRNLDQADDAGKQPHRNQRPAEDVGKDNIMRQRCPRKINVKASGGHFQVVHVGDEIQSLVGNENPQGHPKDVKKAGPVSISPFFDVGNDTHSKWSLYITKFMEFFWGFQGEGRVC